MNTELLKELEHVAVLAAAATPAPWRRSLRPDGGPSRVVDMGKKRPPAAPFCVCHGDDAPQIDNAAFIAAARNLLTPANLLTLTAALATPSAPESAPLPCFVRHAGDYIGWCLVAENDRAQDAETRAMDFASFADEDMARYAAAALNRAALTTPAAAPEPGAAVGAEEMAELRARLAKAERLLLDEGLAIDRYETDGSLVYEGDDYVVDSDGCYLRRLDYEAFASDIDPDDEA